MTFAPGTNLTQFVDGLRDAINQRLTTSGLSGAVTVTLPSQPQSVTGGRLIGIRSVGGAVAVSASPQNDVAAALQLGAANGGIEISRWSRARPAPTGLMARPHDMTLFGCATSPARSRMILRSGS